jgi:flagellar M-ring protein FliF
VPGSLSNRPPAAAVPPCRCGRRRAADGAPKPSDDGTARKNATTRQYAYDRSITQIKRSRGRLENSAWPWCSTAPPHRTPRRAGRLPNWPTSTKSCATAWASTPSAATSCACRPCLPAKAPVAQWWEERDNVVDFSSWLLYALGAVLGYFLILRPLLRLLTMRLAPPS